MDDLEALVEAMITMVHHGNEIDGRRIAEVCKERFSKETISKQIISNIE